MSDIAIKVEGLGKKYQIRHQSRAPYKTFREALVQKCTSLWRPQQKDSIAEDFWALKDVSFEIKRGECVGIIGRNGAGKSTLLKVLSRITEPATGRITLHGRVASLLEVGTGFHQELTGRENIYLNGTILGMKKKEIDRKFDEIVSFAEIEKFLDTPVKRYSSGMYVRLAFAVAAHLEPEILVVDEVLAVGDAQFQKKCLGKMNAVVNEGRTVLFVSHNMAAVRSLCSKGILLESGKVIYNGQVDAAINRYMDAHMTNTAMVTFELKPEKSLSFTKAWLMNDQGVLTAEFDVLKPITINFEFVSLSLVNDVEVSVVLTNSRDVNVLFTSLSESNNNRFPEVAKGRYCVSLKIRENYLVPDTYFVKLRIHRPEAGSIDAEDRLSFTINETGSALARYGQNAKQLSCVMGGAVWNMTRIEQGVA